MTRKAHSVYEAGYHLIPTIAEEDVDAVVGRLHDLITEAGGSVVQEGWPEHFSLEYTIVRKTGSRREKFDTSYFGWIQFAGDATTAESVKEALKKDSEVLRFLLVHATADTSTKSRAQSVITDKKKEKKKEPKEDISPEEIDKEIEKLVAE